MAIAFHGPFRSPRSLILGSPAPTEPDHRCPDGHSRSDRPRLRFNEMCARPLDTRLHRNPRAEISPSTIFGPDNKPRPLLERKCNTISDTRICRSFWVSVFGSSRNSCGPRKKYGIARKKRGVLNTPEGATRGTWFVSHFWTISGVYISAGKGSSSVFFCFADSSCQLSTHLADIYGQLPLGIGNSWGRGRWLLQLLLTWIYCLFRPFSAANLNFSGQSVTTPDLQRY